MYTYDTWLIGVLVGLEGRWGRVSALLSARYSEVPYLGITYPCYLTTHFNSRQRSTGHAELH